jgi:hypothetical protein
MEDTNLKDLVVYGQIILQCILHLQAVRLVGLTHLVRLVVLWCVDTNTIMKLGFKLKARYCLNNDEQAASEGLLSA